MNSEKLLVVGCGDLGRRLAAQLNPVRYSVTGLRRQPPTESGHLRYIAADTTDFDTVARVLREGFDVIVITMTPSESSEEGYRQAYVQTCEHLVTALQQQHTQPRLLVYVSSTSVYGQQKGEWVDETSDTLPLRPSGRRLLEAERMIANSGLEHCIVRFSGIYGPGRDRLIEQVRRGRAILSGRYTNRIHAEDCAGVLAHLIERHRRGEPTENLYLASDNQPAPMAEVVNWLAMQMKVDQARFAPDETDSKGHRRCDNRRLRATGYQFRYPNYKTGYSELLGIHDPDETLASK